jgi:hypothetical protein
MATVEKSSAILTEEMAEMEEVSRLISQGKPVADHALLKRIYEPSE